jgi:hypothetical protein
VARHRLRAIGPEFRSRRLSEDYAWSMSFKGSASAVWIVVCIVGCRTTDAPRQAPTIVPEPPPSAGCEAGLTPGPGPRAWVDTCDTAGRHLVTCWAGHRAVVATCTRCTLERGVPRCEAPKVDLAALLERELPAGLARCSGRLRYSARLRVEGEPKAWVIDTAKSPPTVTVESAGNGHVDATLVIAREHLVDLVASSEWDGMRSFFAGRLRIEGDERAAMDVAAWLSLPRSKERCLADAGE